MTNKQLIKVAKQYSEMRAMAKAIEDNFTIEEQAKILFADGEWICDVPEIVSKFNKLFKIKAVGYFSNEKRLK